MSPFEFFFSFYGLLLGFSVAELVGGFARVLHERQIVRFGWPTPVDLPARAVQLRAADLGLRLLQRRTGR